MVKVVEAKDSGRDDPEPFDQPVCVVSLLEGDDGLAQLLAGLEVPRSEEVLLERPDEALGAAVTPWGLDEGGRTGHAEDGDFLLEVI